jgi:hypothetical protein
MATADSLWQSAKNKAKSIIGYKDVEDGYARIKKGAEDAGETNPTPAVKAAKPVEDDAPAKEIKFKAGGMVRRGYGKARGA